MYAIDVARYIAIDSDELVRRHRPMVQALQERLPGFVDARLARTADGSWLDIITWASLAEARAAQATEPQLSEYAAFVAQIDRVLWSDCLEVTSSL